jgi:aryl-alcohol dehydrogenase-like predicted oxidoreductase
MQYTSLGRTGLQVSRLCLGTMNFPGETPEPEAHRIMSTALDLGINFFDTANVYGNRRGEGATEQLIGRWFEKNRGSRERVVLATKVYGGMGDGPNDRGLSAYHVRRACEESLRRLKTDRIDLYQMHHVDRQTPWDEIWQTMEQLVGQGKILYAGSSNFAGWHIATANRIAAERHFLGLVSEQSKYSLVTRTIELEVIPACRAYGVALIPWSPLEGGILGGVLQGGEGSRRRNARNTARVQQLRPQLERYEALCRELGEKPADIGVAWLLANPAVTAPIIGPRTLDQLAGSLRALDLRLDDGTLKRLDEIWPGPGGEAPEAYAW